MGKFGFTLIQLILFSMPSFAGSANRSLCDFESLTDQCAILGPDAPHKIQQSDGTFIPNFSALAKTIDNETGKAAGSKVLDDARQETHYLEMDVISVLDKIPSHEMSLKFKFKAISNPSLIGDILNGIGDDPIQIPWPINNPDAEVRSVSAFEAKEVFLKVLNDSQRAKLGAIKNSDTNIDVQKFFTESFKTRHALTSEMESITAERFAHVKDLVKFTTDSIVKHITGGKPEADWTDAESAAVKKVRTIHYVPGSEDKLKNDASCMGLSPNAFYNPQDNSINLCAGFYNFPDSTLVAVLAHEMAHSIDPCNSQFSSYSIDKSKIAEIESHDQKKSEVESDDDLKVVLAVAKRATENGNRYTAFPFEEILDDPSKVNYFVKSGLLTLNSRGQKTTETDKGISGYLLSDVYNCLISKKGGEFRRTKESDIQSAADLVVQKHMAIAGASYNPIKDRQNIVRAFRRFPQCISPTADSQMQEATSDWVGSRVLGDFLEGKELKTPGDRLAPIAFFASAVCRDRADTNKAISKVSVIDIARESINVMSSDNDAHPGDKMRIEKIFLSDPRVKKALGCKSQNGDGCSHRTPSSGLSSGKSVLKNEGTK